MSKIDYRRPATLYRYASRAVLERALLLGEFQLRASAEPGASREQILPFGAPAGGQAVFLTLALSTVWDESQFDAGAGIDACLMIRNPELFGERIHRAAERALPQWAGMDAAIAYGVPSPLGAAFTRPREFIAQKEWLFAWRPAQRGMSLNPVVIQIGNIEGIAELRTPAA